MLWNTAQRTNHVELRTSASDISEWRDSVGCVLTPPEVLDTVATLTVGRALDVGCGFGRAALYLAHLGWQVDGVDLVPEAIAEASARATRAGLADIAHFHVGSVT